MKRRILSIITALALCLSLLPGTVLATEVPVDGNWTDGLTEAPEGWSESEDGNTITVTTPEALAWLAVIVNDENIAAFEDNPTFGKTVVLGADLDLGGKHWTPIGNGPFGKHTVNAFVGNFDGNGHTISHLTINDSSGRGSIGLFGNVYLNGHGGPRSIRNVTVENASITTNRFTGSGYVGVLAGQVIGDGSIADCTVSGTIHCREAYDNVLAGGMFGFLNPTTGSTDKIYLTVDGCFADVVIMGAPLYAGGFAGYLGSCGKIINCGSAGDITMTEPYENMPYTGGFIGSIETMNGTVSIESCYATGDVSLTSSSEKTMACAGGFLGGIDIPTKTASIQGCMSSGDVTVTASEDINMVLVGGFIGNGAQSPVLTVANSYSTGDVTAANGTNVLCGGFIGYGASTAKYCYSLGNVTSKNGKTNAWAFGFSGYTVSGANFTNCYALGMSMDGGTHTANFLNGNHTLNNCFYYEGMELRETDVSNQTVAALADDAIMGGTAFSDFDSNVWQLSTGNIPILTDIPDEVEKTNKPVYLLKTITFNTQDGTPVDSQSVAKNGKITKPADPIREGYTFGGWYREAACTTAWNFERDTVSEDMTLFAKWEIIIHTVTFNAQNSTDVTVMQVNHGSPVPEPAIPTKDGCLFDGWYTDADCNTAYDFTKAVTGPLTLYAKWLTVLPNPPIGEGNTLYQLIMATGIHELPAGLHDKYESTDALEEAMKLEITKVAAGISKENTVVYDVTLLVSTDGGTTWSVATKVNFPKDGLTVTLPYPTGTNSSYVFTVVHMFTTSDFNKTPGNTEIPTATKTPSGIRFTVTGLSPISVGWKEPANSGSSGGGSGSSGLSTYPITVEKASCGEVSSNRTRASKGSTVTLTVTPDSGYVLETLTVTDSRGNDIKLTEKDGGTYAFTMPDRAVTVRAQFGRITGGDGACPQDSTCPIWPFTDADTTAWYHDCVHYCLENGLMNGFGDGTFGPEKPITRAQLVQILHNREGRPSVNYLMQFEDVPEGAWYAEAVRWAASEGVVSGYSSRKFGPDDNITREQLALMLWRYAGSPTATGGLEFTDADHVSGYALEAMRWAAENGIITGKTGGILAPQGSATRAEAAAMLMRVLSKWESF